ncbi:hypothetical protein QBC47DRAFT_405030 [Echria macrotheca]|uniref:Uncharacterized protein n=1 Tax=Echria macrotheca TaxID=438768 RepID=A0AAJ0F917_9PEZI|nr:hypothetical protein QBC47DRAFT_405030 [Echria macrotheca]
MPILKHISPLIPAFRRAMAPHPHHLRATAAEAPHLWHRIFGQDSEPAVALAGAQPRDSYWKYWNIADPSVDVSAARPASPERGFRVAMMVFGSEVKGNPTESEADVAADRCEDDPLPPVMHRTIQMPAGEAAAYGRPTDSEERVAADRAAEDPLRKGGQGGYC